MGSKATFQFKITFCQQNCHDEIVLPYFNICNIHVNLVLIRICSFICVSYHRRVTCITVHWMHYALLWVLFTRCCKLKRFKLQNMMMSSNGNIFRVTGPLCGEFTGFRWNPRTKASDAELWSLLGSAPNFTAGDLRRYRAHYDVVVKKTSVLDLARSVCGATIWFLTTYIIITVEFHWFNLKPWGNISLYRNSCFVTFFILL